jgi:hypothetical protein
VFRHFTSYVCMHYYYNSSCAANLFLDALPVGPDAE